MVSITELPEEGGSPVATATTTQEEGKMVSGLVGASVEKFPLNASGTLAVVKPTKEQSPTCLTGV